MFTTVVYMVVNLKTRTLSVGNAGHLPVLLQRTGGKVEEVCQASGTPLGMLPNTRYTQQDIELSPGDRVVLISDGVIETKSEAGDLFGDKRLAQFLEKEKGEPAVTVMQLEKLLLEFAGAMPQFDDQTILTFQAQ
jgi:sigma-B regulation protein RsbU (phosphoserine phosphatase)